MDAVRLPCWLNEADRDTIATAIDDALTLDLHPVVECYLRDVRTELRVAAARDQVWPDQADVVRKASGYTADVLPIRMSEDEMAAVLSLTNLSPAARVALHEGKSTT